MTIVSMRKSYGTNRYGGLNEDDYICTSAQGPGTKPGLIIAHPRGSSADGMFADPTWVTLYQDLAEYFVVHISDLGGGLTWGNAAISTAIGAAKTQLTAFGANPGKVGLLGISMGGLGVFNYAKANPSQVAFVAGIVPAVSLNSLKQVSAGAYAAEIDAAHSGAYSDGNQGSTRSPHFYRASYPASSVRTAIWSSPADAICLPQWHTDMKTAQPDIELFQVRDASGVGPSHELSVPPTINGLDSGPFAFPKPGDWCSQRVYDTAF